MLLFCENETLLESFANTGHVNRSLHIVTGCPWEDLCDLPVPEKTAPGNQTASDQLASGAGSGQGVCLRDAPASRRAKESHRPRAGCACPVSYSGALFWLLLPTSLLNVEPIPFPHHSSIRDSTSLRGFAFPVEGLAAGISGAWLWFVWLQCLFPCCSPTLALGLFSF